LLGNSRQGHRRLGAEIPLELVDKQGAIAKRAAGDGFVPTAALLLAVIFMIVGVTLLRATYFAINKPRSQKQIAFTLWVALASLVISLPALGFSLFISNTVLGWVPALASFLTVVWSTSLLIRAVTLRRGTGP
jgi:hypothetical protein